MTSEPITKDNIKNLNSNKFIKNKILKPKIKSKIPI